MILSWQTHHLCNESLVSYIFLSRKVLPLIFESSMLIYLFILRYTIWYFGKEVLTSYLSKSGLVRLYTLQMLKIKVIKVDWIIELLLPYCKCHCDRITNFKIVSHRHLLVSELLPLFFYSEYDSHFSVPFLGYFYAIWASFDIWEKLRIESLWSTKPEFEWILCSSFIPNLHGVWSMHAEGGQKLGSVFVCSI